MKKVLSALSFLALTSTSVFAAGPGEGSIKFVGELVDAPCVVSADSQYQEVVLGQVNVSVFTGVGDKSPSTPFKIKLENCDTSNFQNVDVSFSGIANGDNDALIALSTEPGAATGVGIGIYDNDNVIVPANEKTAKPIPLKNGQTVLYFSANYVSTLDAVTTGYGNAEVDFNLTYN